MPKLGKLASVQSKECANTRCPDTGASRVRVDRHHTGCDRMWVRHLLDYQPDQPWVHALAARYHEFRPEDCVHLCIMCHEEIHARYLPYIKDISFYQRVKIGEMNEGQVARHTAVLREMCTKLLKTGFTVRKRIIDEYYSTRAGKGSSSSRLRRG